MRKTIFFFILISLFCGSCNFSAREEALNKRAEELTQKEQQLLLREKNLQLKEDSMLRVIQLADSLRNVDSTAVVPPQLIGEWTAKMVCTETNCTGFALGDTRTDQWTLSTQDTALIIKSMNREHISRVYTGNYFRGNTIKVSSVSAESSAAPNTIFNILITDIKDNRMTGRREIIQPDGCRVVYAVEMNKKR